MRTKNYLFGRDTPRKTPGRAVCYIFIFLKKENKGCRFHHSRRLQTTMISFISLKICNKILIYLRQYKTKRNFRQSPQIGYAFRKFVSGIYELAVTLGDHYSIRHETMKDDYFQPLDVNLTGDIRHHYDEKNVLPAHELVIRPLLEKSTDAFVYRGTKDEYFLYGKMQVPIKLEEIDILIKDRGKFKFDKKKECILGNEYLWNATTWKRGSIIFILKDGQINFSELFKNTYRPGKSATPNSGNNASATKKCREEAEKGNIAICLPASNGLEWMTIYAKGDIFKDIIEQAEKNCNEKDYYKRKK
ncbi:hypothetical protein ACM55H_08455 [Flavobacterium sp. ZT3R17]|uniref:hypothetical protein n=1 Tax=Flavobacterium cryoconiti TaxID=3398736 RepID=UPI003A84DC6F